MNDGNSLVKFHHGIDEIVSAKSSEISSEKSVKKDFVSPPPPSSTPVVGRNGRQLSTKMDFFGENYCAISANLSMVDNDSGYMSINNHDTNSSNYYYSSIIDDNSGLINAANSAVNNNNCNNTTVLPPFCHISEDALLETPGGGVVEEENLLPRSAEDETMDSLVNSSQISVRTNFSGFNDESSSSEDDDNGNHQCSSFDDASSSTSSSIVLNNPQVIVFDLVADTSQTTNNNSSNNNNNYTLNDDDNTENSNIFISPVKINNNNNKSILGNVTNTNNTTTTICDKKLLTNNKRSQYLTVDDKENQSCNQPNNNINKTPQKHLLIHRKNAKKFDFSPDLFGSDDDDDDKSNNINNYMMSGGRRLLPPPKPKELREQYITRKDVKLLKNVQSGLRGVFPPPSVTILQISAAEMLDKIRSNFDGFMVTPTTTKNLALKEDSSRTSLLIDAGCDRTEAIGKCWPDILNSRHHGLMYNRGKISEEFELLCAKYADRHVGAETQSSCTAFESNSQQQSPSKRKFVKNRWTAKSPGRRLSHLARRRITFSSVNLQSGGGSGGGGGGGGLLLPSTLMGGGGGRTRQILVDAKKLNQLSRKRSPKKTPSKKMSPFKKPSKTGSTPSSASKMKLLTRKLLSSGNNDGAVAGTSTTTTNNNNALLAIKRTLFASPDHHHHHGMTNSGGSLMMTARKGTKRALFTSPCKKKSPLKKSPYKISNNCGGVSGNLKKRKCSEIDGDGHSGNVVAKFSRSMSCIDIRSSQNITSATNSTVQKNQVDVLKMNRTKSDSSVLLRMNSSSQYAEELSEIHKKKLQWAVYESLRAQNISSTHPQFKQFANVLARVTRRFLPNLSANAPRPEGGTSDRMLRIARHHSYAVVKGKSVDEIIQEYHKSRVVRTQKPQGYVGIEDYNNLLNRTSNNSNSEC